MRIRTQIILAAFVLAVVPLAAIVTYSYHSSRRALESAYGREADRLTRQMDRRLVSIRAELDQRLAVVSALPIETAASGDVGSSIATVMGEAASFVDSIEFQPIRTPNPDPDPIDEEPPDVDPPPAPQQHHALMIDLPVMPHIPRYAMSEEQRELTNEIRELGESLAATDLDPEEKKDIQNEMNAVQSALRQVIEQDRAEFEKQMGEARRARNQRMAVPAPAPAPAVAPTPAVASIKKVSATPINVRQVTSKDIEKALSSAKKTSLILGRRFEAPVRTDGKLVGQITARISSEQVIRRVLGRATEDGSEIPFALDREGTFYTRTPEERTKLEALNIPKRVEKGESLKDIRGWIVTNSTDPQSGLRIGVARPVGENLDELQRTAGRNFALGMGLIFFAMIGIVPLSNHLTRDVKLVTDGAERIAQGDLMTRLPVKTDNELGQLAKAFNRMAEDLSVNQQKLVEQERARKEQELQQRLMTVEYERKSVELEDARRFQLSMLPKELPRHEAYDVAVYTRTATEVGGDYYDFHLADDVLSVTIGDATGHGAKAGTMVTVIKTLFAGYSGAIAPADFLHDAAEKIKRMELGRMAMALSIGRFERRTLTISSAGMPPVLVHRAETSRVEEVALSATPLGTLGSAYEQIDVELAAGDTVLFLSDGFPELMNDVHQQLGYTATLDAFGEAARGANAQAVIESLSTFSARWHGDAPPNDDVTFVVVRIV
ncbi:MAG TPA: SpoIIE family protein phosphatase [Thermoanaerobaculia bacterium]|jgi:serine phosphatase RsbU (regulator of sigma subunit)|nr:SpoIIE family protein phosphatase [Thermoanaerobaculia bacterium]